MGYVYLKSQKKQQEMTTSGITDWYATTEAGMNQLFFHNFNACFESATQSSLCVG